MSELRFKLAAGTNVGLIRQNNEDNFIVCPDLSTSQWLIPQNADYAELGPYGALLVVADGMGGMNAGEVASAIAIDTIQEMFSPDAIAAVVDDSKAVQEFMVHVVKTADLKILNRSRVDSKTQGMGTTVVMAWILGQRAYVCWCGDSRCYAMTQNHGLIRLSRDHSYVQELVDKGELSPEYASSHPLSNVITRCLGNEERRAEPETRVYELYDGDTIMLCSDGLCGLCSDEQIAAVMGEIYDNPMDCKNELITMALSRGGHDNVTVALATVRQMTDDEYMTDDSKENQKQKSILANTIKSMPIPEDEDEEPEEDIYQDEEPVEEELTEDVDEEEESVDPEDTETENTEDDSSDVDTTETEEDADNDEEVSDDDEEETESSQEEESDLSATLRNEPVPQRRKGKQCLLWFLILVLFIAAVCCIYYMDYFEPLRTRILDFYNTQLSNIKQK